MELIQEIGSYAGFAAVVGLAVLSALYFSQARDVKRLRDWAGRAPERAAEIEAGGRAAAAVPVAARPQPQVAQPAAGAGSQAAGAATGAGTVARPAAAKAGTAAPAGATAGAAAPAGAAASSGGAAPATTTGGPATGAPAGNGTEEGADHAAGAEPDDVDSDAAAEKPSIAPAAATAAGAVASAGTAEREPGTAVRPPGAAGARPTPAVPGETGTGAKVLPARRPAPPVRPRPTVPPRTVAPRGGQPSVLGQAPGSRPPARGDRGWREPRYIALIVGAIIVLGLGGTVGVLQLTKDDASDEPTTQQPDTDVGDPTASPDRPEPARVNPTDVTVTVLNATSETGLAGRVLSQLESAGFKKGNSGNAVERQRAESVVMYTDGNNDEARAVARRLDIGSIEPIDQQAEQLAGPANVVVVLGADKAGQ